ncbi:MAG: glycosyltransferase, partial [Alphaproteobacteria bacterium]|nr:glycosyltransferase [Alphaproteobacteria bacterium]
MEFSVVIPTYNREGLIGRCLDSIISQAHEPSEIVVVDDGSIDATERLITR